MAEQTVWGVTLAELAGRAFDGEAAWIAAGRRYAVLLAGGVAVDAESPLPADSPTRIALIQRLIAPSVAGRVAAEAGGGIDEIAVIARVARLTAEQVDALAAAVVARRAARTFAAADEPGAVAEITAVGRRGRGGAARVDLRAVTYAGARQYLSEDRLVADVRGFGAAFVLAAGAPAAARTSEFGFGAAEEPVLAALADGGSLAELEARCPDADPRMLRAMIYALASFDVVRPTRPRLGSVQVPVVAAPEPALAPEPEPTSRVRTKRLETDPGLFAPRAPAKRQDTEE